ncbi:MAG: GFA family protein [Gammaproteobacteria bacterium]|nr:GFA family protein [Gammaproteobacteria bacterium]
MTVTGRCLCGAVSYKIDSPPLLVRTCWCRLCQTIGAGSATVNAVFPSAAFAVTGEFNTYTSTADSGNIMHRRFCPRCGTHVFGGSEARPDIVVVRVKTLDEPENAKPAMTIWTSRAPSWASIDSRLPTFEAQPPPPPRG